MRILILGSGGREHALALAFHQSPSVHGIFVSPGNDGMKSVAQVVPDLSSTKTLIEFCQTQMIDLVVVGPEEPLVNGVCDELRRHNIPCVGPSKAAAQLEGSKVFAKDFMFRNVVPTSKAVSVSSVSDVQKHLRDFTPPYVLKADGLCAGKGVFICQSQSELEAAAHALFEKKIFGQAGSRALLEQHCPGYEISYLVLTNGEDHVTLPLAQDHKRLRDQDQGPNTGGMGTRAPMHLPGSLQEKIENEVVRKTLSGLKNEGLFFRGVLFIGLMIQDKNVSVLEYNCRFGDPETQVILPLLDIDFGRYFLNLAQGQVDPCPVKPNVSACCVVLAAPGYPEAAIKGVPIRGLSHSGQTPIPAGPAALLIRGSKSYLVHAGTKFREGVWSTQGGRVLGCVGLGNSEVHARQAAYSLCQSIQIEGGLYRRDIGSK